MDGCEQGSMVIICILKQNQELLNFNLKADANSFPDPGQGEVHSCSNHREFFISFQPGQDVIFLEEGVTFDYREKRCLGIN